MKLELELEVELELKLELKLELELRLELRLNFKSKSNWTKLNNIFVNERKLQFFVRKSSRTALRA